MKTKIFFILLTISLIGANIKARSEETTLSTESFTLPDTDNKTVVWGIKGHLSAEMPTKWYKNGESEKVYNSGFGASLGGLMNVYLGQNFYFEPELSLFYEGYSYNNIQAVAPNSPSVNVGPNIYKLGIRIPVNFGYFIDISEKWGLDLFTGPQLSYAFYGNAKTSDEDTKSDTALMSVFSGPYAQRRLDLEWKIGIGFPVERFLISLEADLGVTDMLKNSYRMRENRLSLGITYYFE